MGLSRPASRWREAYIWRILVIDDDEDDYLIVRRMLANAREGKFTLEWSPSFEEGIKSLQADRTFDAVVVDYSLGVSTGIEFIREAVAMGYPAPFLLLTGRGTFEIDVEAMEAGAADYLPKGEINAAFLERAIRYAIERKKNETALRESEAILRESEATLRESEARFRAIFENRHSMMWLIDPETGKIVDANQAACEYYGYSHKQLLKMTLSDINTLPPKRLREKLAQARSTRKSIMFQFKHRLADGTVRDVEVRTGPVTIGGRELLFSILNDITEHKQTQAALSQNEKRLREATDHLRIALKAVNLGVWSVNLQGEDFFADEAARRMHGFTELEELADRNFANTYMHPDDKAENETVFQKAVQTGVFDTEYRVLLPSGEVRWIYAFGGLDPSRTHLHGVVMDITERKQIENTLRSSEEKFARAFHSSPTGLTITHRSNGLIIDANGTFLQMVEYTRDEVIGHTSIELGFHQSAQTRAEILRRMSEPGGVRNYEIPIPTKSGRILKVLYSIEPVEIGGQPCLLSTFLDVTEIRRLEEERIEAAAEMEVQRRLLEQREKERQGIARELHDGPIQTLASTTFHIQLIKEAFPNPALLAELSQVNLNIKQSIRELRELLNDLRPPALMHFGLSKVIQMYNIDMRERYPELDITVDIIDSGSHLPDQTCLALFRIYQESLNNIIRHSGASKVQVVFHLEGNNFTLALKDNGKGFVTSKDLSRLTREGHFGLAGMKERAEAVGAELTVTSGIDQGTIIQVCGPVNPENVA